MAEYKTIKWRGLSLFILAILLLLTSCQKERTQAPAPDEVLLYINDLPVYVEEFEMILMGHRAGVYTRHSSQDIKREDFWTMEVDQGKSPVTELMEKTLSELQHYKTVQALAIQKGLAEPFDFYTLKSSQENINAEREQAKEKGQVVYGLTSYDEYTYYKYVYSNLETSLVRYLEDELSPDTQQLQHYYKDTKEDFFIQVKTDVIVAELPYTNDDKAQKYEESVEIQRTWQKELQENKELTDFSTATIYKMTLSNQDTQAGKMGDYEERWKIASQLMTKECAHPFESNHCYVVIGCTLRKEDFYPELDDIKQEITQQFLEENTKDIISKAKDQARLVYDEEILYDTTLSMLSAL